ncbi:MAG: hypothetical protein Q4E05_11155 [Pseudoclavibacter sp.]|nr:hypothetical protein [Pseudoclavibacter sp.]
MPGALRTIGIEPGRRAAMDRGDADPRTLVESLAVDHAALLSRVLPGLGDATLARLEEAGRLTAVARFRATAEALLAGAGSGAYAVCAAHPADTARAIAVFLRVELHRRSGAPIGALLPDLRGFAADRGVSVREWAWLAARPVLAVELREALDELEPWTAMPEAPLRRFPLAALRPRARWSRSIPELLERPGLMRPHLDGLRLDPAPRVRRALAEWIREAARSDPAWARGLAERWLEQDPDAPALRAVLRRALGGLPGEPAG